MSRSNGPLGQPGGQNPPARQPVQQQDPYAGHYQPPRVAPQPQQQHAQWAQHPQAAHDDPQAPFFFPAAQTGGDPAARGYDGGQPTYAPMAQPDPRTAAPRSNDPRSVDPRTGAPVQQYAQQQHSQSQLSSLQRGPAAAQSYGAQPLVPPYGQYNADPYPAQPLAQRGDAPGQWPPADASRADPARYDLNQYPPQTHSHGAYPGVAPGQRPQSAPPQDWQPAPPTVRTGSPSHGYPAEPSFGAPQGYNPDPRQARGQPSLGIPPPNPNDGHGYHGDHADGHDDGEYEDDVEQDPPKRRRKGLMLVVGLVGAIGVGAGCAYAYKTYFGSLGGRPPLLKADAAPNKTKPAVPGGKEFANADRKVTSRLGEDGAPVAASDDSSSEPGGPRKVQIIPISPNGSVAQPPPARANPPTVSVPGMAVEFGNGPGPRAAAPPTGGPAPVVQTITPPPAQGPSQGPARVAVAQVQPPAVAKAPVVAQVPNEAPAAAVKKAIVAKAPTAKASDAFSPGGVTAAGVGAGAVAPPANANGGVAGFVAVVASQQSPKDAMTAYADLKQKYPEVLGDKPADVREAVVNGKTWHRAVVGPPGSRASVDALCSQLKAAGFLGCWASTY